MKKILTAILLLCSLISVSQETLVLDKIKVYDWGGTTAAGLYKTNNNAGLPLVIYAHGRGESVMTGSLFTVLKNGFRPPFPCIIIAPQYGTSWGPPSAWLPYLLKDAYDRFKYDTTRIYLTGLSAGGDMTWGGVLDLDTTITRKIAAIAPLSPYTANNKWENIGRFKTYKTPVWSVCGDKNDGTELSFMQSTQDRVKQINAQVPGTAELFIRSGLGHCCWGDIYNGTYKDSKGRTIWDFFKDKKTGTGTPPVVIPPVNPPAATVTKAFHDSVVLVLNNRIAALTASETQLKKDLALSASQYAALKAEYDRIAIPIAEFLQKICPK